MSDTQFQWDAEALLPETITVPFKRRNEEGTIISEDVTFTEMPRQKLIEFITEAIDHEFLTEVEVEKDGKKTTELKRTPFKEVADRQACLLFKYLAECSGKSVDYFRKLNITGRGMGMLVELLYKVNHIEEVASTGGNWLLLPQVREVLSEKAAESSGSPQATSQA